MLLYTGGGQKGGHRWKYGWCGITFIREQKNMHNIYFRIHESRFPQMWYKILILIIGLKKCINVFDFTYNILWQLYSEYAMMS